MSERTVPLDIVGMPEIADRLGVKRQTVRLWKNARDVGLPPADFTSGGRSFWLWVTIEAWARDTGRLK